MWVCVCVCVGVHGCVRSEGLSCRTSPKLKLGSLVFNVTNFNVHNDNILCRDNLSGNKCRTIP